MKYDEVLKKNIKSAFCVSAISEIHAVLAVLCEIDKAIALHACRAARDAAGPEVSVPTEISRMSISVSPDIDYIVS